MASAAVKHSAGARSSDFMSASPPGGAIAFDVQGGRARARLLVARARLARVDDALVGAVDGSSILATHRQIAAGKVYGSTRSSQTPRDDCRSGHCSPTLAARLGDVWLERLIEHAWR